jgi:uncharacterized protein YeaO (DUF488 family)
MSGTSFRRARAARPASRHRHRPEPREYSSPACSLHEFAQELQVTRGRCEFRVKRIYEAPEASDGQRLLVDRLWPRGIRKDEAALDDWLRDLAPSTELRVWFGHEPGRWAQFQRRYRRELAERGQLLDAVVARARQGRVTLLYAARDVQANHAMVLQQILEERCRGRSANAKNPTRLTRRAKRS